MRKITRLLFVFLAILAIPLAAQARVRITVDLSSQQMYVSASSGASFSWPISSARSGYVTPRGVYSAVSLQTMHRSKKYHNSPMPHSIFFRGGYAIHGTYETASLGRPASHGCVRISPANAATLFSLVRAEGATIQIVGSPPPSMPFASASSHHRHHYASNHRGKPSSVLSYAPDHHNDFPARIFGAILLR
ncbi:L,D-transpeptidase [Rhodoblastus sp.]|uniref:L,D-transpeptidase n=1 Tax=Rhodoblastus sp. TaxID=1962975 RepID=UPI003F9E9468